ncbi:parvalbumin, thymic-like isoform X2 [Stegostoma tigrinum]|uniref:parvalbumin, thymic-like isoform X2 n=1 Tax=Stegostoma tigrinum TaxID=3053191 RepID=UPI00202B3FFA|nr:parvalbumin, thymic-like isoform X2 [Stegostoma tigrinum]
MKITDILGASDINSAILQCKAPESFDFKKFFEACGLSKKSTEEVKKVFAILDQDGSGFIDKTELKLFLQYFSNGARQLSDNEAQSMLSAADNDGDGKIRFEEFQQLVQS